MAKYYLSDLLKSIRSERGLIQEEFAKELGISVATLKNAERGATSLPNSRFLSSLSEFCNEKETDTLQKILYLGYGYPYILNIDNIIKSGYCRLDLCRCLLANYTASLHYYEKMAIMTELSSISLKYSEDRDFACIYSCLRKGHNPTNILVPVVADEPVDLKQILSPFYEEAANRIKQKIACRFKITGRFHIEIAFIVDASIYSDSDMRHILSLITEKPNKSGTSYLLYNKSDLNHLFRYYKRENKHL